MNSKRPPTPVGWSDTDWIEHLEVHPLSGQHINQGSVDAAADAYEAEYNKAKDELRVLAAKGCEDCFPQDCEWPKCVSKEST